MQQKLVLTYICIERERERERDKMRVNYILKENEMLCLKN